MHGVVLWMSTMYNSVCLSSVPRSTGVPSMWIVFSRGLNTVACVPWKRTARSPAQIFLTDSSGMVISLNKWASRDISGSVGILRVSLATEVMTVSSATCARMASLGPTG